MKVSIIVPVYNGDKFLSRAIESVLNQKTNYSYEIIIINDCSTDKTQDIINKYLLKNKNIKNIKNKKNIGVNESRNKAIKKSKGEYIAFLDADDEWRSSKIEKQINLLEENKDVALCFSDFSIYNDFNEYICDNFQYWNYFRKTLNTKQKFEIRKNIFPSIIKENIIGTSSVVVRKAELQKTTMFKSELGYSQDWDLWLNLSLNNKFSFIKEPLMKYYMVSDSITRKKRTKTHLISIVEKYKKYCTKKTYKIAKSNCYAFIAESAFIAENKKEATKFYMKSFILNFRIYNFKKYIWHLIK